MLLFMVVENAAVICQWKSDYRLFMILTYPPTSVIARYTTLRHAINLIALLLLIIDKRSIWQETSVVKYLRALTPWKRREMQVRPSLSCVIICSLVYHLPLTPLSLRLASSSIYSNRSRAGNTQSTREWACSAKWKAFKVKSQSSSASRIQRWIHKEYSRDRTSLQQNTRELTEPPRRDHKG